MHILVIRNHRLGDILQLTPMLKGLKRKYPDSRISFMTGSEYGCLLSHNRHVDRIIRFKENQYRHWLKKDPSRYPYMFNRLYDLCADLQDEGIDLVINRQYEEGGLLADILGRNVWGGRYQSSHGLVFDDQRSEDLYKVILSDRRKNKRNLADWSCLIAGVSPGESMELNISSTDQWAADRLLAESPAKEDRPLIGVQLGAAHPFRQWGPDRFSRVISLLVADGNKIVLVGTANEKEMADKVKTAVVKGNGQMIDLVGKTSIPCLAGIMKRCDALITGDTGTMHVAAAVGTPVLAVFYGTAYPWETGPYGTGHVVLYSDEPCAPCLDPSTCRFQHRCKSNITPNDVYEGFLLGNAMRNNRPLPAFTKKDGVKTFVTCVEPGCGQSLIPADQWTKRHLLLPPDEKNLSTNDSAKSDGLPDRATLLEPYFRGDGDEFFSRFQEYLQRIPLLCEMISTSAPAGRIDQTEWLNPVLQIFQNAVAVLQTGDAVRLADFIQYKTADMENRLRLAVKQHTHGQEYQTGKASIRS
ncbi:MAG: glycosyltransferase family 9 protein [Deltaproteobacteria bacterium]|nr:glycosyltransferase family 9 protein [Deltaproteobacteria bacterium]